MTTYYANASTGNDSNNGDVNHPVKTLTHGYSLLAAGDTLLCTGTFTDFTSGWGFKLGTAGTSTSLITIKASSQGGAILDCSSWANNLTGVYFNASYNILDGFKVKGAPNIGCALWASHCNVQYCEITNWGRLTPSNNAGNAGIYEDTTAGNSWLGYNKIHDGGVSGRSLDHGIYACGSNTTILKNSCADAPGYGIQMAGYSAIHGTKVDSNLCYKNAKGGIVVWQAFTDINIWGNDLINNSTNSGIYLYGATGSGIVCDSNFYDDNAGGNTTTADGTTTATWSSVNEIVG